MKQSGLESTACTLRDTAVLLNTAPLDQTAASAPAALSRDAESTKSTAAVSF